MSLKAKISILMPARNEEHHIPYFLESVLKLNYGFENIELILGNDNSEDTTLALMQTFAKDKKWVQVIDIEPSKNEEVLKGKARALNIMAKYAKGEFLFFADADIILTPKWIEAILAGFTNPKTGVVVGLTHMKSKDFFSQMQSMEWLSGQAVMHVFGKNNIPTTGMGNNMAVTKNAYEAVGGYDGVGFSIVEDYALYMAIIHKGYDFVHLMDVEALNETSPPPNFMEQRKRWTTGAMESKSSLKYLIFQQALYFPILIMVWFVFKPLFYFFVFTQIISVSIPVLYFSNKLRLWSYLKYLPFYILYIPAVSLLQILMHFNGKKVMWKGREY